MEKAIETVELKAVSYVKGSNNQDVNVAVVIQGVPSKESFIEFLEKNELIENAYSALIRQVEQQVKARAINQKNSDGGYDEEVQFIDVLRGQGTGRFSHKKAAEILQEEVNKLNAELAALSADMVTALTGGNVEQATQLGQQVTELTEDIKTKQEKIGEHLAAHAETAAKQAASRKANKK
jgi:hypothetical protein